MPPAVDDIQSFDLESNDFVFGVKKEHHHQHHLQTNDPNHDYLARNWNLFILLNRVDNKMYIQGVTGRNEKYFHRWRLG